MIELVKSSLIGQFEATLAMLRFGIVACPDEHWERKIANGSIRWAAYHALFITDLYLSKNIEAFIRRDFHDEGGDERNDTPSQGLDRSRTLEYLTLCVDKARESIASESEESLKGSSGIPWYSKCNRLELYMVTIRHAQHHAAQLHAYLRREGFAPQGDRTTLPWVGRGWRELPGGSMRARIFAHRDKNEKKRPRYERGRGTHSEPAGEAAGRLRFAGRPGEVIAVCVTLGRAVLESRSADDFLIVGSERPDVRASWTRIVYGLSQDTRG